MRGPPPHPDLRFALEHVEGEARAARFETPHGPVETPAFMPVATSASLKGLTPGQIDVIDPAVVLANTYHLHLRPGEEVVRALGGLHGFAAWDRPVITDSGGYQVFSLGRLVRVDDEGVRVRNHLDGRIVALGPREAMRIQEALGADLVMAFDHCLGLPADRSALAAAVARTTRWTRTCAEVRTRDDQALFGIVQGGTDEALRMESLEALVALDLPGYAIGGLAVGEGPAALRRTLAFTAPRLPADRPRYLMGVGPPPDLLDAVAAGIDLFDCVQPSRNGRRGHLWTEDGPVRIASRHYARSEEPLEPTCPCEVCRRLPRGYLRHLFRLRDQTSVALGTLHNVTFTVRLLRRARAAIAAGTFGAFRTAFLARWQAGEAAWRRRQDADPHGAARSRAARRADD